jgi:hypothetical protein
MHGEGVGEDGWAHMVFFFVGGSVGLLLGSRRRDATCRQAGCCVMLVSGRAS